MTSGLVDFHCHLDLYPNHSQIISDCDQEDIFTLAVTTTPRAWPRNNSLALATRRVRAALGLHPQLVHERAGEIVLLEEYLPQARYIGEIGLDASPRFFKSLETQKQIFERVLRACSRHTGKILSVHSFRTSTQVLDMIEKFLPASRGRVVLHWFTGSQTDARRATQLGCYFSINSEMLKGDRHRALVATLPVNRILTETDGPFTRRAGLPQHPRDVTLALDALAQLRGLSFDAIAAAVRRNLRELVSSEPG